MTNRFRLTEYVQGGKWNWEEFPKVMSSEKANESDPRREKGDTNKGKCPYIFSITDGELSHPKFFLHFFYFTFRTSKRIKSVIQFIC